MSSAADQFFDIWGAMVTTTARTTPRQESTAATPQQVDLAAAMRKALADMITGDTDLFMVADRIELVAAALVASLRMQPPSGPGKPMILDEAA